MLVSIKVRTDTKVTSQSLHLTLYQVPLESVCLIDKYSWLELDKTLGEQLLSRLAKNLTVPLVVIR